MSKMHDWSISAVERKLAEVAQVEYLRAEVVDGHLNAKAPDRNEDAELA